MKYRKLLLVTASLVMFLPQNAFSVDIKVIANPSVRADMISVAELKRVFLEQEISLRDGSHVEPVLERSGPVHEAFLQKYLATSGEDLQIYYRTLLFTGKGSIPKDFASDAEVVAYIVRTRGAIGYVSSASIAEGVKTLAIDSIDNVDRKLISLVEPDYPETLKRLNIGGTVRLRVSVSAKGNVEDVKLLGGSPILGESAALAVWKWVYAAGRSRTVMEITVSFGENR